MTEKSAVHNGVHDPDGITSFSLQRTATVFQCTSTWIKRLLHNVLYILVIKMFWFFQISIHGWVSDVYIIIIIPNVSSPHQPYKIFQII